MLEVRLCPCLCAMFIEKFETAARIVMVEKHCDASGTEVQKDTQESAGYRTVLSQWRELTWLAFYQKRE